MEKFDENWNPIVDENEDKDDGQEEKEDEPDYKTLLEQEQAKREKAEANFKKMAKQFNEMKKTSPSDNGNVAELVSKQVAEEMYYANNPIAREYQKEIKEIQSKTWMSPEDAMTFYIAKNKPELIQRQPSTWVDWVSKPIESKKDPKDMTYEELWGPEKKRGV